MKLKATKEIRVFIDKGIYGNIDFENTNAGLIPKERRDSVSWKGCYYIIKKNETFIFDRGNDWDRSYFILENKAEFLIWCSNPISFINENNIEILN